MTDHIPGSSESVDGLVERWRRRAKALRAALSGSDGFEPGWREADTLERCVHEAAAALSLLQDELREKEKECQAALGNADTNYQRWVEAKARADRLQDELREAEWAANQALAVARLETVRADRLEQDLLAARDALKTLRGESEWLARQLAAKGQPGSKGDCVEIAFAKADAIERFSAQRSAASPLPDQKATDEQAGG